ncbi:hypothetical protein ACOME3_004616 [Neoechinorhynchus agilis]
MCLRFVLATDISHPFYETIVKFDVNVLDVNDNAPIGDFPSQIDFREDIFVGTTVVKLNATDLDNGQNSSISYALLDYSAEFNLTRDGFLKTIRQFDRENNDTCFELKVKLSDNGQPPRKTIEALRLCVVDVNDNCPSFNQKSYVFKVNEDAVPGTTIGHVSAIDLDVGDNAKLSFSFCFPVGKRKDIQRVLPFSIDQTGTIKLSNFVDYEEIPVYATDVCVHDFGHPKPLTDRARVRFFVENTNDNPPRFFFKENVHFINRDVQQRQPCEFTVKDMDGHRVEVLISSSYKHQLSIMFVQRVNNSHKFELYRK